MVDPEGTPYAFISYASADRERVLSIVSALREADISCWLDQHDIEGGANWGLRITEAIEGCSAFVLMSSAASLASRNVRQEVAVAWKYDKPYLPLLLDPTPVPRELIYWLEAAQWIDVRDQPEHTWLPKAQRAIQRLLHQPDSWSALPADHISVHSAVGAYLPNPPSSLIGRDREVMEVAGLLQSERIVTLTGPGGIGKTRIAIAVGHRMADAYSDGVVFIDLAPVTDPARVVSSIAARLNVREAAGQPIREQLALALARQRLLLILDNFEQVIDAASDLSWLIALCPSLAVLSTSREPLRISGEVEYSIAPLQVPYEQQDGQTAALRDNPAIALFVQRARTAKPGFDLTSENVAAIAAICTRLDGLPLAIELAAARIRALSPHALLERLNDPLRLLTGGARDLPDRQRTIRDTIQWSYNLLTPDEQRLIGRLSVFVRGWTLVAAEAVVNPDGLLKLDIVDGLLSLADKNLITGRDADGEIRYDMLTTIREFASERLDQHGDVAVLQQAQAAYVLRSIEALDQTDHDVSQFDILAIMDREFPNIHAAIHWGLAHDIDLAARIIVALDLFWTRRAQVRVGYEAATAALAGVSQPTATRVRLLDILSNFELMRGDLMVASDLSEEAVTIARALGDMRLLAEMLNESADVFTQRHEAAAARERYEEALAIGRRIGNDWTVPHSLLGLGTVAVLDGDLDGATTRFEEALSLARQRREPVVWGYYLSGLADTLALRGEVERALLLYREMIAQPSRYADVRAVIESIEGIARITTDADPHRAATLLGSARAARGRIANEMISAVVTAAYDTNAQTDRLRQALGAAAFTTAWEDGQRMTLDAAIAFASEQSDG